MTEARVWTGTKKADSFLFSGDYDRFDYVKSGAGNDLISDCKDDGLWSSDAFYGQRGNDTLISHGGHDFLHGGRGADTVDVRVGWYDPATVPGGHGAMIDHDVKGFDVRVFGGWGHDILVIRDSDGYSIEQVDDITIIHTRYGGTITARGIEEFQFVL